MTERQLRLSLTDDDWRALDAMLKALAPSYLLPDGTLAASVETGHATELSSKVAAIRRAIDTRHHRRA